MLDANPTVNKFLGSSFSVQNIDDRVLATEFLREFTFSENLVKAYISVVENPSPEDFADFYKTYQNFHKDCFEQDVDFKEQIRQLEGMTQDHPNPQTIASNPAMMMSPEKTSKSEVQEIKKEEAKISHFATSIHPNIETVQHLENGPLQNLSSSWQPKSAEFQKNVLKESIASQHSNQPILVVNEGLKKTPVQNSNLKLNVNRIPTEYDDIDEYDHPSRPKAETYGQRVESIPDIPLVK
jgi:hypothetical protein